MEAKSGYEKEGILKPTTGMKFRLGKLAEQSRMKAVETQVDQSQSFMQDSEPLSLFQQQRTALSTHSVYVSCLKSWWAVLRPITSHPDPDSEDGSQGHLPKSHYLSLSVRIQKSLLQDFHYDSACLLAEEDWVLDADHSETLSFHGLSEFLLDLIQELNPGFDPVATLYVLNALMLNVSVFKDVRDIPLMPDDFFQTLFHLPTPQTTDFSHWYRTHFFSISSQISSILSLLHSLFPSDIRINDIWPVIVESTYGKMVLESIARMDKALNRVEKVNGRVVDSVIERSAQKTYRETGKMKTEKWQKIVRKPKIPSQNLKKGGEKDTIQLEETPMLDPRIYPNRLEFRRLIHLPVVGHCCDQSVNSEVPGNEGSERTVIPPVHPSDSVVRPVTRDSDSQSHLDAPTTEKPRIPVKTAYKSAPDSPGYSKTHREDVVSSGRNNVSSGSARPFHRNDIKYSGLPKAARKGRFIFSPISQEIDMRGRINRKSQHEISLEKELNSNVAIQDSLQQAETQKKRLKSLPLTEMRSTNRKKTGENKEEVNSETGSLVEKTSIPEQIESEIKVSGRSLSPSKAIFDQISPFPSQNSQISTPHPQSTIPNLSNSPIKSLNRVTKYDFKPYSHLLRPDNMPEKLEYDDPLEFLYALNVLKYQYNKAYESEFLKVTERENVYESRRDELGGAIEEEDWKQFIRRIERLTRGRRRRRRNRRLRRKRLGLRTRKQAGNASTLQPNLKKDALWQSVFVSSQVPPPPPDPKDKSAHRPSRYIKQL